MLWRHLVSHRTPFNVFSSDTVWVSVIQCLSNSSPPFASKMSLNELAVFFFFISMDHLIKTNKLQSQKFLAYIFVRRQKFYMSYFCIGNMICTSLQNASLTPIHFIVHWVWNKTRRKLAFTVTFSLQGPIVHPKYLWRHGNALQGHLSQAWNHWWCYIEDFNTIEIVSEVWTSCSWW